MKESKPELYSRRKLLILAGAALMSAACRPAVKPEDRILGKFGETSQTGWQIGRIYKNDRLIFRPNGGFQVNEGEEIIFERAGLGAENHTGIWIGEHPYYEGRKLTALNLYYQDKRRGLFIRSGFEKKFLAYHPDRNMNNDIIHFQHERGLTVFASVTKVINITLEKISYKFETHDLLYS